MLRKFTVLLSWLVCLSLLFSGAAFAVSGQEQAAPMPLAASAKKAPVYNLPSRAVDIYQAFQAKSFTATDGTVLKYRIFIPDGYTPEADYPLLLILHGAGERGDDNSAQMRNAVQNLFNDLNSPIYGSIVICPQCPNNNQWVDTPWSDGNYSVANVPESNELKAVVEILDSIKNAYSVDDSRVYGFGLSMGGFGTWDLMMRHPDLITAGVPLCGGADVAYAQQLVEKPIWTIHDSTDGIVPVSGTRAMVNAIKAAGGSSIIYEELQGYGHNVWDYASTREGLMNWLFSQIAPCETHTEQCVDNGDGTHRRVCSVCGRVLAASEQHTGTDDGDCTTPVSCACGVVLTAGKTHDFTGEIFSDEIGHWHVCGNENCTVKEARQPHRGGTATYFEKAVCLVCEKAYGDTAPDTTAPAGQIKSGEKSLSGGDDTLFFKEALDIRISASDTESGMEKTEYFLSTGEIEDPSSITGWKAYTDGLRLEADGTYVVYARLTDKAGNAALLSSDRIVLDSTAPAITGVKDGGDYCDAVTVEIADAYLDSVTLNGSPVTPTDGKVVLSYRTDAQTLVATDKAGNTTAVKITVHDGHLWGQDEVVAAATAEKEGQIRHTCTRCGEVELKTTPKQPAASSSPADQGQAKQPAAENPFPKTGDAGLLPVWLAAVLASGGLLLTQLLRKKRTTR